jgi:hypothetical protein
MGVPWSILVPRDSSVSDPQALPCLDRTDIEQVVASLDEHLRSRTSTGARVGVVIYEANTDLAAAIARVVSEHPTVRFLVNLFRAEPGLDVPLVRRKRFGSGAEAGPLAPDVLARSLDALARIVWPSNVMLTAESDAKALMARSAGLPVRSVWQLHSEMAAIDAPDETGTARSDDGRIRVLVALRSSQLHAPLVRDVLDVIDGVDRADRSGAIEWVMSGRFDPDRRVTRALRRLERAGVRVTRHERPLEPDAYARGFLDVDAVWMPATWPYRIQSSGKALDALVLGRPVIAPAGTAGADAMARWVPGAPAYGTTAEAIQLFLRLPTLNDTLTAGLLDAQAAIREHSSPAATIGWVLDVLRSPEPGTEAEINRGMSVLRSRASGPPVTSGRPSGEAGGLGVGQVAPRMAARVRSAARMLAGLPRGVEALWHALLAHR